MVFLIDSVKTNVTRRRIEISIYEEQFQRLTLEIELRPLHHLGDVSIPCMKLVLLLVDRNKKLIPSSKLVVEAEYDAMLSKIQNLFKKNSVNSFIFVSMSLS